jgi:hypothetical protein
MDFRPEAAQLPILLFEISTICSVALRLDSTTELCSISATAASNSFHSMQRKDKSRKLNKIGLSFGGGFPLQGAGYGDGGAFRKSARAMRGYLSRPPTVTRCGSLPRTKCRSVVSDL